MQSQGQAEATQSTVTPEGAVTPGAAGSGRGSPAPGTNPLSGFPGTAGTVSGDFHRNFEKLFEDIFMQERQRPCLIMRIKNDLH